MDFEKKLEQLRIEINSMSKKIIKLRASYKSLKKIYLQEISKSAPVKKIRKNYYVSKIKAERLIPSVPSFRNLITPIPEL